MTAPTRPDKVRARETLETRVRTRIAQLEEVLTRELAPRRDTVMRLHPQSHYLASLTPPDVVPETDDGDGMTIAEALATLAAEHEAIVAHTVDAIWTQVHRGALVPGALRGAVLGREELARRWPWDEQHHASALLAALVFSLEAVFASRVPDAEAMSALWGDDRLAHGEPRPYSWPPDVAPLAVAEWAEPKLKDARETFARFRTTIEAGEWGRIDHFPRALAVLYVVRQAVEQARKRAAMAIPAGRPHHDLVVGWRDLSKDTLTPRETPIRNGRIELLALGGGCVQLTLNYDGAGSASEALIPALREMRGWKGLRHWAAVLRLLSVEGGRRGWVRWTLDGHLAALGVSVKNRSKAAVRAHVARQVEAFTKIDLAVYAEDGTLRARAPILIVGTKYDRLKGSTWELDGMELTINPLLYAGVREPSGRIGRNWHPAPVELAQVDDVRHPHTLALGLILPMRWRRALDEDNDHITITGENALRLAGIPYKTHDRPWVAKNGARAWDRLERDLAELARIEGCGRWFWDAADTPRTLAGRLHFWPDQWALDRTRGGVRPRELPPGPAVLTGAELKAWRKRRGFTQPQAAKQIGVSRPTIARAEAQPLEPLSTALAAKIREAGA